jgi:hypothetical protein
VESDHIGPRKKVSYFLWPYKQHKVAKQRATLARGSENAIVRQTVIYENPYIREFSNENIKMLDFQGDYLSY